MLLLICAVKRDRCIYQVELRGEVRSQRQVIQSGLWVRVVSRRILTNGQLRLEWFRGRGQGGFEKLKKLYIYIYII